MWLMHYLQTQKCMTISKPVEFTVFMLGFSLFWESTINTHPGAIRRIPHSYLFGLAWVVLYNAWIFHISSESSVNSCKRSRAGMPSRLCRLRIFTRVGTGIIAPLNNASPCDKSGSARRSAIARDSTVCLM
jgi:hypothetical protein